MEHFEYIANLLGIEHIASGPDTMFGDHVALHNLFAAHLSIASARGQVPIDFVDYVDGIENAAEAFTSIVRWLVSHGYSDDDIGSALASMSCACWRKCGGGKHRWLLRMFRARTATER
jgi:membrane dipeptidase